MFRYFATVSIDGVPYMRQDDFIRSITPGQLQPPEYRMDMFEKLPTSAALLSGKETLFDHDINGNLINNGGFISFSEYLFLLSCLAASKRHFELLFQMVDEDKNSTLDAHEFTKVQRALHSSRLSHAFAAEPAGDRSIVFRKFFGKDGAKKLSFQEFAAFVDDLQDKIVHIAFLRHNKDLADRSRISERGLAKMLLKYAHVVHDTRPQFYERVRRHYESRIEKSKGVSLAEVRAFFSFLRQIDDAELALSLFNYAGCSIGPGDLQHCAAILKCPLSPAIIEFIFVLFDENGDGRLHYSEFIAVMKQARNLGSAKQEDLGFVRGMRVIGQRIIYNILRALGE